MLINNVTEADILAIINNGYKIKALFQGKLACVKSREISTRQSNREL